MLLLPPSLGQSTTCKQFLNSVLLLLAGTLVHAGAANSFKAAGVETRRQGQITVDGLTFSVGHYAPSWQNTGQNRLAIAPDSPPAENSRWTLKGSLPVSGSEEPLVFHETLEIEEPDTLRVSYELSHPTGVPTQEVYLGVDITVELAGDRTIVADGVAYSLPSHFASINILSQPDLKPRELLLPSLNGMVKVSGIFGLQVQDRRKWHVDSYTVRLRFPSHGDPMTEASLGVDIRQIPQSGTPLPLTAVANRGLHDETAGDGQGGWTDQGPANDIGALPTGPLKASGIPFTILDPSANDGKAALVLGGGSSTSKPLPSTTLPVAEQPVWKSLYLLHAAAWLPASGKPVGDVEVRYADGTTSRQEIVAGRDVGNWWMPAPLPNAAVGWKGSNSSSPIGLYVSRIALEPKPVTAITFQAAGRPVWMIAGLSGSTGDVTPRTPARPFAAAEGGDWVAYPHTVEIIPGSVFDFSDLNHAPAGQFGRVVAAADGHFQFADAPGRPVRFWGVNLVTEANYLSHEQADLLAARLARSGYNLVRLHHYDRELIRKEGGSTDFDPERLDQLDYLFAALKKAGIYVDIDLFSLRGFTQEEMKTMGLDPAMDRAASRPRFKLLVTISDDAFSLWKSFAQALLTHRNPYTGLTWGEDPTLMGICPLNENSITPDSLAQYPEIKKRYAAAYHAWQKQHQPSPSDSTSTQYVQFLIDVQQRSHQRIEAFLRSLHVDTLLTGSNNKSTLAEALLRSRFDFVDNHGYWDHPQFPERRFQLPHAFGQMSCVRYEARMIRDLMVSRVFGKPFMVSEFNFVRPNQYRAEGGILMPVYASLQDWDAVINYKYANSRVIAMDGVVDRYGTFSIASDPINLMADRISALLFRRSYIAAGTQAVAFDVDQATAVESSTGNFPDSFGQLGLVTRIGSVTGTPVEAAAAHPHLAAIVTRPSAKTQTPRIYPATDQLARQLETAGILPDGSVNAQTGRFVSDTRQIELASQAGWMKVVASRCELFVAPEGQMLTGSMATLANGPGFSTVSVLSIDDQPLATSRHFLVVHLTDSNPTGMSFGDSDRRLLTDRGHAPHLLRLVPATLTFKRSPEEKLQAWAVDATGKRLHSIPLPPAEDGSAVILKMGVGDGVLAYEIVQP